MFIDLLGGPPGESLHVIDLATGEVERTILVKKNPFPAYSHAIGNNEFYVTEYGNIVDCRTRKKIGKLDHGHQFGAVIHKGKLTTLSGVGREPVEFTARIVDLATNRVEAAFSVAADELRPARVFWRGGVRLVAARKTTGYFTEETATELCLFAFDFATAKTQWRLELPHRLEYEAFWLDDNTLALPNAREQLEPVRVDVTRGKRLDEGGWGFDADTENRLGGLRGCVHGEHVIAFVSGDYWLVCLNESDGGERWRYELAEELRNRGIKSSDLAVCAGHVLLLTPKGLLRTNIETGTSIMIERPAAVRHPSGHALLWVLLVLILVVTLVCSIAWGWFVVNRRKGELGSDRT